MCNKPESDKYQVKPHLRTERDRILIEADKNHADAMDSLHSMINHWSGHGSKDVKKNEMKDIPVMEWIEINAGVWIRRRSDIFDMIVFDTIVFEGCQFGIHMHSDCEEVCDMLKGSLTDLLTGKVVKKYELFNAKQGVYHHVSSKNGVKLTELKEEGLPFDECIGTQLRVYFK